MLALEPDEPPVRLFPRLSTPGVALSAAQRHNVASAPGTVKQRADAERVSQSSVRRIDALMASQGHVETVPRGAKKGAKRKLSEPQAGAILWMKLASPSTRIAEIKQLVLLMSGLAVSSSLISREYNHLKLSKKTMHYFSTKRDAADRAAYWINPPNHAHRPGVNGVNYFDIVDIDESGSWTSDASRTQGHSIIGLPCQAGGRSRRAEERWSYPIAVDARVGMVGANGTSSDKFYLFLTQIVLPALRGTGRRYITMDNLDGHKGQVEHAIRTAGHVPIFRPTHSPDFGPVEWVFSFTDSFMRAHDTHINDSNLRAALEAAFSFVTPFDIASYFACAHFAVPGHTFKPYMGELC